MRFIPAALTASLVAAGSVAAQNVRLPLGQNLHGRPDNAADVVLTIDSAGGYTLNGRPIAPSRLPVEIVSIVGGTIDRVLYVRADARLRASTIDSAMALAIRGTACVASLVGMQEPGTVSRVLNDVVIVDGANDVRRAIALQLPWAVRVSSRPSEQPIVLEVLRGPAYRINQESVRPADLLRRLMQIYEQRPIKVLYVRSDTGI